jgi:HlyD family secretion protein
MLAGAPAADITAAESSVVLAQSNLDLKRTPYTAADIATQRQAVIQAEANLTTARTPSTPAEIEAQRLAVASAQQELALKQNPYKPSDVLSAQASVGEVETRLATAQKNLDGATIVAPFDGVVSAVSMAAGESAGSSSTITIVDPNDVAVNVQVDEADITRVAVGQRVFVTFEALAGRRAPGMVRSISPSGTTTQGVVGYLVGIDLDDPSGVLPGMTATAQIVSDQRADVLLVPNRALIRATGNARGQVGSPETTAETATEQPGRPSQVRVLAESGEVVTRQIRVGLANDQSTEVISGLEEGDQVVLPTTTARAAVPGAGGTGSTPGFGGVPGSSPRF